MAPWHAPISGSAAEIEAVAAISSLVSTSLADVESTQNKLQGFFLLITLIVLLFIGLLARWIIRISLRPLREVEHTAAAIADGDYSARLPKIDESTEVGRLSASLNTMLGRIEESFQEHQLLMDALTERNAALSVQRMKEHFANGLEAAGSAH